MNGIFYSPKMQHMIAPLLLVGFLAAMLYCTPQHHVRRLEPVSHLHQTINTTLWRTSVSYKVTSYPYHRQKPIARRNAADISDMIKIQTKVLQNEVGSLLQDSHTVNRSVPSVPNTKRHMTDPSTPPQLVTRVRARSSILIKSDGKHVWRRLTIFNADWHKGVTIDILSMALSRGGREVYAAAMPINNQGTWLKGETRKHLIVANSRLPRLLTSLARMSGNIATNQISNQRDLFNYYKNSDDIKNVDAFLCAFPSSLCEAFFSFNKTVIFAPAHRFSIRRCSKPAWKDTIRILQAAAKFTNPRHFVVAMSRYDAEYINYFTGLKPLPLYASSQGYIPKMEYRSNSTREEILVGPLHKKTIGDRRTDQRFVRDLIQQANKTGYSFSTAHELYNKYDWKSIMQHKAAVILPYAVMSYGMTELYTLGMLLFVPSMKMMKEYPGLYPNDRTMTGPVLAPSLYCAEMYDIIPEKHPSSRHPHSPESNRTEAKYYWLQFADFYQWPHITYFDSVQDLFDKLHSADLDDIHRLMVQENASRERKLDETWQKVADGMDVHPRIVPSVFRSTFDILNLTRT